MWPLIGLIVVAILVLMYAKPVGNFVHHNAKSFVAGFVAKPNGTSANVRDLGPAATQEECERLCADAWCKAYTWVNGRCYGLSSVGTETDDATAMSGVKTEPATKSEEFSVDEMKQQVNQGVMTFSNTLQRRLGMGSSGAAPERFGGWSDNEKFLQSKPSVAGWGDAV